MNKLYMLLMRLVGNTFLQKTPELPGTVNTLNYVFSSLFVLFAK